MMAWLVAHYTDVTIIAAIIGLICNYVMYRIEKSDKENENGRNGGRDSESIRRSDGNRVVLNVPTRERNTDNPNQHNGDNGSISGVYNMECTHKIKNVPVEYKDPDGRG